MFNFVFTLSSLMCSKIFFEFKLLLKDLVNQFIDLKI